MRPASRARRRPPAEGGGEAVEHRDRRLGRRLGPVGVGVAPTSGRRPRRGRRRGRRRPPRPRPPGPPRGWRRCARPTPTPSCGAVDDRDGGDVAAPHGAVGRQGVAGPAQVRAVDAPTSTRQPSAAEAARPASTRSWGDGVPVTPGLLLGVEDVDAAEPGRRAPVAHRRHLPGLGLAAAEGAAEHPGLGRPRRPWSPRSRWWWPGRRRQRTWPASSPFRIRKQRWPVNWKLKRCMSIDQERSPTMSAVLHAGDQAGGAGPVGGGLQGHVGHALDGDVAGESA